MNDNENNFDYIAHVNRWQVVGMIVSLVMWMLLCIGAAWLLGMT